MKNLFNSFVSSFFKNADVVRQPIAEGLAGTRRAYTGGKANYTASRPAVRQSNQLVDQNYFSDPDSFYRVVHGKEAFDDIISSGLVRTNAASKLEKATKTSGVTLGSRPTAFPSFSKGQASMTYAQANDTNFIIVTKDKSIQPSTSGRHGKGSTMFPTIEGVHQTSLSAASVDVFEHVGSGKYRLAYSKGAPVGHKNYATGMLSGKNSCVSDIKTGKIPNNFDLHANATGNAGRRHNVGMSPISYGKKRHGSRSMGGY